MPIRYGIILANDVTEPKRALEISEIVAPYVDGIKIGITTILDTGLSMINKTKKLTGKLIIADFKIADIGFWNSEKKKWEGTNAKIVEKIIDAGADYVICHSIIGTSSIQECIEIAHSKCSKILTLPYMTHKGAELFFNHPIDLNHVLKTFEKENIKIDVNKLNQCQTISDVILVLGNTLNVDGFVGPANNPSILERYRKFSNKEIFGPGIGRQTKAKLPIQDQLRIFYEICGKNSSAIIGSAIYDSETPQLSAKTFNDLRNDIIESLRSD